MCRIGRDEQDRLAHTGELDGEGAGGSGLANAAFTADENPSEGFLLQNRVEGRFEGIGVIICVDVSRHFGGYGASNFGGSRG